MCNHFQLQGRGMTQWLGTSAQMLFAVLLLCGSSVALRAWSGEDVLDALRAQVPVPPNVLQQVEQMLFPLFVQPCRCLTNCTVAAQLNANSSAPLCLTAELLSPPTLPATFSQFVNNSFMPPHINGPSTWPWTKVHYDTTRGEAPYVDMRLFQTLPDHNFVPPPAVKKRARIPMQNFSLVHICDRNWAQHQLHWRLQTQRLHVHAMCHYGDRTPFPRVSKWSEVLASFSSNLKAVAADVPQLQPIPVGVFSKTDTLGNRRKVLLNWTRHNQARTNVLYSHFTGAAQARGARAPPILARRREPAFKALYEIWNRTAQDVQRVIPEDAYYHELTTSKFTMAPPGLGIDSCRIWEALYVGTVPILADGTLDPSAWDSLPLLFVRGWDDVTPAFLQGAWTDMVHNDRTYDLAPLFTPWQLLSMLAHTALETRRFLWHSKKKKKKKKKNLR
eukprot:NODE_1004_length_1512_cov_73.950903_g993_i0.p1 GENE.NODE_1004_length_1512_cov_73.950903_g993_i0~~NODE_1004_length_1512_cov_73.950903_g993_i0.p1  ORF type:complete len:446 (-),score=32.01 NODE_1004_length_1512_cov_73.950903_g993_i0:21-1358(-)